MPERLFALLQYPLPQHGITRIFGWLAQREWPWLVQPWIRTWIRTYGVDMSEAEFEQPEAYATFNAFFTRALKSGVRTFTDHPQTLSSPVDGVLSEHGRLNGERLLQAKGHEYDLSALLGDRARAAQFNGGDFATLYLAPGDYHRIHMPLAGRLIEMRYIPGRLFSVNQKAAAQIPGLFARNERVVCYFQTDAGVLAMVLVGAMIVGGIETTWAGTVSPPGRGTERWLYPPATVDLRRGEEAGCFRLGSTVILITEPGRVMWDAARSGPVRLGDPLAHPSEANPINTSSHV